MRKYYGVAGTRGYGVYNNWYQARNARFHIEDITSVNVFYTKRDVSYEEYREKTFVKPFTINPNHN